MRCKTIPPDAEVIRTFDELRKFRESFFNGEFHFLVVVGRPGLAKTREFEEACQPRRDREGTLIYNAKYIKGNVTPVEAYRIAYEHRDKLLVFDDSERLWSDSTGRYLLRDLTECTVAKWISWRTANRSFQREGIPKSFLTSSRVCLLMNRFAFGDAFEYEAIVDRAQFIYFDPTPLEVHRNTALWFWDQEVFDFIGEHLHVIDPSKLSSRSYLKAYERKSQGDWQEFIAGRYFAKSAEQWVVALEQDPRYPSVDARITEFICRTGLSRSTYFNSKKHLSTTAGLTPFKSPNIKLTARPPGVFDPQAEAKAATEQQRRQAELRQREEDEEREYRELEGKYFPNEDDDPEE